MLQFCCLVGKSAGHPVGPKALTVGQDRMRAQQQWTGSARISGEPEIWWCRIVDGRHAAVGRDYEPCRPGRRARLHTNFSLSESASSTEPTPELRASTETITRGGDPDRCCRGPKDTVFVPPVDATTQLPPNNSSRPIGHIELQRIVNRR